VAQVSIVATYSTCSMKADSVEGELLRKSWYKSRDFKGDWRKI